MADQYISIKCIQITQPIGLFYVGVIDWKDLKTIAYSDIRRIENEEKNTTDTYLGIQRDLSPKRIKEIAEYVRNVDATFPTSIILHIPSFTQITEETESRNLIFDVANSEMQIRLANDIASILDGQHRIEGLKESFKIAHENSEKFQLNVTIFVDLDMDDQSMIFSTVNKAQTKVNKSLVYDLFSFAKSRSPQRTAHNIVKLLNDTANSPFKDKIKILGRADDPDRETITQATLAELIIKYISKNPYNDRDLLIRGKKLARATGSDLKNHIFRNLFIDEKDEDIAENIWNLFEAAKDKWPLSWSEPSILNKSTGVIALMKFLRPAYLSLCTTKSADIGATLTKSDYAGILRNVNLGDDVFTKENYLPGTSGQSALYKQLTELI
ncbi:DGQHR domain-containing protein [Pedobacter jejuensis]|uniref:DGQHR domain-containing protein n=1 Tax=Pedobacter jejuensis TaxID=1268550 RepID=A0A3N0C085_9SPHI|nr:DGQHR domain-containing protein [Pedobacter jejuensis]RNL55589.1 DGQHR domain-containing protein [Pedobacter jejuensis]